MWLRLTLLRHMYLMTKEEEKEKEKEKEKESDDSMSHKLT
jgi:hypothetical protein